MENFCLESFIISKPLKNIASLYIPCRPNFPEPLLFSKPRKSEKQLKADCTFCCCSPSPTWHNTSDGILRNVKNNFMDTVFFEKEFNNTNYTLCFLYLFLKIHRKVKNNKFRFHLFIFKSEKLKDIKYKVQFVNNIKSTVSTSDV